MDIVALGYLDSGISGVLDIPLEYPNSIELYWYIIKWIGQKLPVIFDSRSE